jgi:hypothetical protein
MPKLLYESIPSRVYRSLPKHFDQTLVRPCRYELKNRKRLAMAAMQFDEFVTFDKDTRIHYLQPAQNVARVDARIRVMHSWLLKYAERGEPPGKQWCFKKRRRWKE